MKTNKNENECPARANETAQAPPAPENNETSPAPAGGCLPRPCSALSDRLLGQSDIIGPAPDGWDKIAEANSKSLEKLTKK